MRHLGWLLIGALLLACQDGDTDASDPEGSTSTSGDDGSETGTDGGTDTEALSCDDAPVITYETFGRGFLSTYCNGCHGAEAVDRQNAPADVVFDTRAQATDWADRIYTRVFPTEGTTPMPPAGGIVPDDEERARIWLTCYP